MSRRAAKTDGNQLVIVEALRAAGASVYCTHTVGHGFPDLVAAHNGTNYLIEVKTPKGRLTADEKTFIVAWDAPVHIVRSVEEALDVINR